MAEGGSTFFFDTNIESVVDEIEANLRRLQRVENARTKGTPESTTRALAQAPKELGTSTAEALRKLEAVRDAATKGLLKGNATLSGEFRKIFQDLDRELGTISARRGINLDVALKFREETLRPIERLIHDKLDAATRIDVLAPKVGNRQLGLRAQDFGAGFGGGSASPELLNEIKNQAKALRLVTLAREKEAAGAEATAAASREGAEQEDKNAGLRTKITGSLTEEATATAQAAGAAKAAAAAGEQTVAAQKKVAAAAEDLAKATEKHTEALGPLNVIGTQTPAAKARSVSAADESRLLSERRAYNDEFIAARRTAKPGTIKDFDAHVIDQSEDGVTRVFRAVKGGLDLVDASGPEAARVIRLFGEAMQAAAQAAARATSETGSGFFGGAARGHQQVAETRAADQAAATASATKSAAEAKAAAEAEAARQTKAAEESAKNQKRIADAAAKAEANRVLKEQIAAARRAATPRTVGPGETQEFIAQRQQYNADYLAQQRAAFPDKVHTIGKNVIDESVDGITRVFKAVGAGFNELGGLREDVQGLHEFGTGAAQARDAIRRLADAEQALARERIEAAEAAQRAAVAARQAAATDLEAYRGVRTPPTGASAETSAREEAIRQERLNAARLRAGGSVGREFGPDVVGLGRLGRGRAVADVSGLTPQFFTSTTEGFRKIENESEEYYVLHERYLAKVRAEAAQNAREFEAENERAARASARAWNDLVNDIEATRVRGARSTQPSTAFERTVQSEGRTESNARAEDRLRNLYTGTNAPGDPLRLRDNVSAIGQNYFKEIQDGTTTYFKVVGKGLKDITNEARELSRAIATEAKESRGGQGVLGNFLHGALSGGFGAEGEGGLNGLSRAAGTTLKYSLLYQTLGLLQQALGQVGQEMLNFQDSNTNLAIAIENTTGATKDAVSINQGFLNSLESIGGQAGVNVGDVMDVAAAGIRTLGTDAAYTQDQVTTLATEYARQVQTMAVLSKTTLDDAAGNTRAVSSAFDIPITSVSRINDALVTAKNVGGGDEKQTSQGLATFAEAANYAGFTLEQAAAIVSRIQAKTDKSGASIGSNLARITTIAGGAAGQAGFAAINSNLPKEDRIDLNAKVGEQLNQLSRVNDKLSDSQRKSIVNTLAGTTATKEFLVVLDDLYNLTGNNGKGLRQVGVAAEEYNRRLRDLTQTVRDIQGAFSNLIINVANSGLLDPLVAGFKLVTNAVQSLSNIFGVFDLLPPKIRHTLIPLLELAAALYAIGKVKEFGGITSVLGGVNAKLRPADELARLQLADRAEAEAKAKAKAAPARPTSEGVAPSTGSTASTGSDARTQASAAQARASATEAEAARAQTAAGGTVALRAQGGAVVASTLAEEAAAKASAATAIAAAQSASTTAFTASRGFSAAAAAAQPVPGTTPIALGQQRAITASMLSAEEYATLAALSEQKSEASAAVALAAAARAAETVALLAETYAQAALSLQAQVTAAAVSSGASVLARTPAITAVESSSGTLVLASEAQAARVSAEAAAVAAAAIEAEAARAGAVTVTVLGVQVDEAQVAAGRATAAAAVSQTAAAEASAAAAETAAVAAVAITDLAVASGAATAATAAATVSAGELATTAAVASVATAAEAEVAAVSGLATLASGLGALFNPLSLAIGAATAGFLAIGAILGRNSDLQTALKASTETFRDFDKVGEKPLSQQAEAYRNNAASAESQRSELIKARAGIGRLVATNEDSARIKQLRDLSELDNQRADDIEYQQKHIADGLSVLTAFGDPAALTAEKLTSGLEAMTTAGVSATQQIKVLSQAIHLLDSSGKPQGEQQVNKAGAVSKLTGDLTGLVTEPVFTNRFRPTIDATVDQLGSGPSVFNPSGSINKTGAVVRNPADALLRDNADLIKKAYFDALPDVTSNPSGKPTAKEAKAISQKIVDALLPRYIAAYNALDPEHQAQTLSPAAMAKELLRALSGSIKDTNLVTGKSSSYKQSGKEVLADILTAIQPKYEAAINELLPGDDQGRLNILKAEADAERAAIKSGTPGDELSAAKKILAKLEADIAGETIDQMELDRKAAQNSATSTKDILSIGQKAFVDETLVALRAGNFAKLKDILSRASRADIKLADDALQDQIDSAQAALDAEKEKSAAYNAAHPDDSNQENAPSGGPPGIGKKDPDYGKYGHGLGVVVPPKSKAERDAEKALGEAKKRKKDFDEATGKSTPSKGPGAYDTGADSGALTAEQIRAESIARTNRFADNSATLDAAKRAMDDAKTNADALKKGQDGYEAAQTEYIQKQRLYAEEAAGNSKYIVEQLGIDLSNPVQVAALELQKARDLKAQKLKEIKDGTIKYKGTPEEQAKAKAAQIGTLELDVRQKEINAEQTVQQAFLSDAQNALSTGRISHSKYVQLLTERRQQLKQQLKGLVDTDNMYKLYKDELKATDDTIKSASDTLKGVFNIGDIDLPKPYEVRRAITQKYSGDVLASNGSFSTAGNVTNDNSVTSVTLNGVPLDKVLAYLKDLIASPKTRANIQRKATGR